MARVRGNPLRKRKFDAPAYMIRMGASLIIPCLRCDPMHGGLAHLRGLKGFKWMTLTATQMSDEGVPSLRQRLPDCNRLCDVGTNGHSAV